MIPFIAAKAIPFKGLIYVGIVLAALHFLGIYPIDLLLSDFWNLIASILGAIENWIANTVKDALNPLLVGGIA